MTYVIMRLFTTITQNETAHQKKLNGPWRGSTKTGIPKSMLGHHFDQTKTTRKDRGHIAGDQQQSKVLPKGKQDFLTILATETCVISK